jgi:hypothetical protein
VVVVGANVVVVAGSVVAVVVAGTVLVVVGTVLVVVVVLVVDVVDVVGTVAAVVTSTDGPGVANRCEPGATSASASPGASTLARTSWTVAGTVVDATPEPSVVAVTDHPAPPSKRTSIPPIGPPGPVSRTAADPSASTSSPSDHGPRLAVASACSATTVCSTAVSRPTPSTRISSSSPCHTDPPPRRWAFVNLHANALTAAACSSVGVVPGRRYAQVR